MPATSSEVAMQGAQDGSVLPGPVCRVLIVDDDPSMVAVLGRVLAKRGLAVTSARGSVEARECAASGVYDVALVDLRLRDGNGLALRDELELRWGLAGRVLLMTGGTVPPGERCMRKPFDFAELARQLAALAAQGMEALPPGGEPEAGAAA